VINVPATVTIQQAAAFIYITITSSERRSQQTLCWHSPSSRAQTCLASYGSWRVKLRGAPGRKVFVLRAGGKIVAQKTVAIKLKS
jgi:hypothetical protein